MVKLVDSNKPPAVKESSDESALEKLKNKHEGSEDSNTSESGSSAGGFSLSNILGTLSTVLSLMIAAFDIGSLLRGCIEKLPTIWFLISQSGLWGAVQERSLFYAIRSVASLAYSLAHSGSTECAQVLLPLPHQQSQWHAHAAAKQMLGTRRRLALPPLL